MAYPLRQAHNLWSALVVGARGLLFGAIRGDFYVSPLRKQQQVADDRLFRSVDRPPGCTLRLAVGGRTPSGDFIPMVVVDPGLDFMLMCLAVLTVPEKSLASGANEGLAGQ